MPDCQDYQLINAANVPIPDIVSQRGVAEYASRRTLFIDASLGALPWGLMALLIVVAASIRLITGHGSWIAFFGGVILSFCIGWFSSCQV